MACCCFPYPPPVTYLETEKIGARDCRKDTEKRNLKRKEETVTASHSGLTEEHDSPVFNCGSPSSYSFDSVNRTGNPTSRRKRIRMYPAGEVSLSAARKEENDIVSARSGRRTGANVRRRRHRSKSKKVRVPYDAITNGWEFDAIQAAQWGSAEDLDWLFNSRKPHARRIEVDWEDDSSFSTCLTDAGCLRFSLYGTVLIGGDFFFE